MRALVLSLTVTAVMAIAGAAAAMDLPSGVKMSASGLTDASGKPLYVWDMDTMRGMSHCSGGCAAAWPPLLAPPGSKPEGDWSLVAREDGTMQWAFRDKPLYTFAKDVPGEPPKGSSHPHWSRVP